MSQCQQCEAKSQLFLCNTHIAELRTMLEELLTSPDDRGHPRVGLLEYLADAAVGRAKLGDSGRASTRREPFKGEDDVLPKCACRHREHEGQACTAVDRAFVADEFEIVDGFSRPLMIETPCRCEEYRPVADQAKIRRQFLAVGRVNARAADLLDEVTNTLSTWVRDICETRRVRFIPVRSVQPGFIGPLRPGWRRLPGGYTATPQDLAEWLAAHISAVASGAGAGQCFADVQSATERIEHMINRPIPQKFLGACPTWNDRERQACGKELRTRADAIEVTCPKCRQTHNCNRLQLLMMNDLEREKLTVKRILELNRVMPEEYRISERTLRRWRKPGPKGEPPKLKPRGYLRPDGREVITRHSDEDEPMYAWADIRRIRAQREAMAG